MDAAEVKMSYEDYQKTIVNKPPCDPILAASQTENDCFYQAPKKPRVATYLKTNCSCVLGINAYYHTNFRTTDNCMGNGVGCARSIRTSSNLPSSTGFVVTYESWAGHIAHYYLDGDFIVIDWETNYVPCQITSGRKLPINSPSIKGFIN